MTKIMSFYTPSCVVYRGRRDLGIGLAAENCIVLDHPPTITDYENVLDYSFKREDISHLQRMPSCGSDGYSNEDWSLFCSLLYRALRNGSTRHFAWLYCTKSNAEDIWLTGRMIVVPGDLDAKNFRLYLFCINDVPKVCVRHMEMVRDAVRAVLDRLTKPCENVMPPHTLIRFKGAHVSKCLHPIVCLWWQLQASKRTEFDAIFQFYSDTDAVIDWKTDFFFKG